MAGIVEMVTAARNMWYIARLMVRHIQALALSFNLNVPGRLVAAMSVLDKMIHQICRLLKRCPCFWASIREIDQPH